MKFPDSRFFGKDVNMWSTPTYHSRLRTTSYPSISIPSYVDCTEFRYKRNDDRPNPSHKNPASGTSPPNHASRTHIQRIQSKSNLHNQANQPSYPSRRRELPPRLISSSHPQTQYPPSSTAFFSATGSASACVTLVSIGLLIARPSSS